MCITYLVTGVDTSDVKNTYLILGICSTAFDNYKRMRHYNGASDSEIDSSIEIDECKMYLLHAILVMLLIYIFI